MNGKIRQQLVRLADERYRKVSEKITKGTKNILGISVPKLRKIAQSISKENWVDYAASDDIVYFEELMLQGMVIGYSKLPISEILMYVENFIPKINNWGVCDTFCSSLNFAQQDHDILWKFLKKYLSSEKEFEIRFAVVMIICNFITENHINLVFQELDGITHNGYYAKMAVAWAISICFIKFPDQTMEYLQVSRLITWTYNKALQKIIESRQIDNKTKSKIRLLKR